MPSNAEIAREGFAAAARGEYELVAALLHPDVRWHGGDPDAEDACRNRDQALTWMRRRAGRRAGAFPDVVDVVQSGERVVVIMRPPPTPGDPQPGLTANLASFRDGLVVEMVHYASAEKALAALAGP